MIIGPPKSKGPAVNLADLIKVKTLGTGTFGRVKLVQHKKTKQVRGVHLRVYQGLHGSGLFAGRVESGRDPARPVMFEHLLTRPVQ